MRAGFELFKRPASARDLENTAWGDSGGREIVIADYWYAPSSNPSLDDYRRFVCVIEARPAWADLSVTPTSVVSAAKDAVGVSHIDLESEGFNRAGVGFEIIAGRAMMFQPRSLLSLDDVDRALRRFDGFLDHVPPVLTSLFPGGDGSPSAGPGRPDL